MALDWWPVQAWDSALRRAVAREFGLSRTPVRAALKRQLIGCLATADAGQGIHVAQWTDWDIEETFRLRMLLGPCAASLAAAFIGPCWARQARHACARSWNDD